MAGNIEARLKELGIALPAAAAPVANYVPYVVSGNLVFVSGQITLWGGEVKHTGVVGDDHRLSSFAPWRRHGIQLVLVEARRLCRRESLL